VILEVILWTASILKVVSPGPDDPLYLFRDPACALKAGEVRIHIENLLPEDPTARVGWLERGKTKCDLLEVVYPGV